MKLATLIILLLCSGCCTAARITAAGVVSAWDVDVPEGNIIKWNVDANDNMVNGDLWIQFSY